MGKEKFLALIVAAKNWCFLMSDVDFVDPIVLSIGRPLWSISHYIWS